MASPVTDQEMVKALDEIMVSLHSEIVQKEEGEFSTADYAKKNGINMQRAHKELQKFHEDGRLGKRKGSKEVYWRPIA